MLALLEALTSFPIFPTLIPIGATADYSLIYPPTGVTIAGTMDEPTINIAADIAIGEHKITVKATGKDNYSGEIRATFKLYVLCFTLSSRLIADYTCADTNVVIPSIIDGVSVTSIGNHAFKNNQLTSVSIKNTTYTNSFGEDCTVTNGCITIRYQ